ncbi:MAG: hypothetical protein RBT11_11865 [Desulfobacterales bacterium]|jgi:hypothetical protein|nr:hypothetical protein [Desulfobacterales bacterium]
MRIQTIRIETDSLGALERAGQQFAETLRHGDYAGEVMSFESPAALFRLLTPARWGFLAALQKAGPSGIRALARVMSCGILPYYPRGGWWRRTMQESFLSHSLEFMLNLIFCKRLK